MSTLSNQAGASYVPRVLGVLPQSYMKREDVIIEILGKQMFSKWKHCKYRIGERENTNIDLPSVTLNLFRFWYLDSWLCIFAH